MIRSLSFLALSSSLLAASCAPPPGAATDLAHDEHAHEEHVHKTDAHHVAENREDCEDDVTLTQEALARYVDDQLTVVVLSNLAEGEPSKIAQHVAEMYLAGLEPGVRPPSRH